MDGENVDDDISILDPPSNEDDIEIDAGLQTNPIIPFSPFSGTSSQVADDPARNGAFDALKKAFTCVEERLNSSITENRRLKRRIRKLESSAVQSQTQSHQELDSFVTIGESFDMMDDLRYVTAERAGLQTPRGTPSTTIAGGGGAGEGHYVTAPPTSSNARQPVMQATEGEFSRGYDQYREKTPDKSQAMSSLNYQVAKLRNENSQLQQGWESERKQKESALQELQGLREKCCSLQSERDKAVKEGASLLTSLQKANQEVSILKERQEESLKSSGVMVEPPPEVLREMVHMRQVIDKLKTMVLWQKDCLMSRSMSMSRASLNRSPLPAPTPIPAPPQHSLEETHPRRHSPSPPQAGSGGANSTNSWEMVHSNGVTPLVATAATANTTDPQVQLLLQQKSAKMMGAQLASPRITNANYNNAASNPAISGSANMMGGQIVGKPIASSGSSSNNNFAPHNQGITTIPQNTGPASGRIGSPRQQIQKPQTEMIHQRRRSEMDVTTTAQQQAKGKIVDAPTITAQQKKKAHTLPQQTPAISSSNPHLADWMGNHYQQRPQQGGVGGGGVGLNQFMRDGGGTATGNSAGIAVSGQVVSSRVAQPDEGQYVELPLTGANYAQPGVNYSQPGGTNYNYPQQGANNYPQRQASPPTGFYDNVGLSGGTATATNTGGTTTSAGSSGGTIVVPGSMHILNQSSMTGGRVLQNNSGGFTNAGTNTTGGGGGGIVNPPSNAAYNTNSDRGGETRPSPSSNLENARPGRGGPTDLDLNPEIRFVNELPATECANPEDRRCPVCTQDFRHITMDEFQSHVFECFDDSEENSTVGGGAPTLQPMHGNVQGQSSSSGDKVCPMCDKSFAASVNQDFFVTHVQSHFEDVVNHFEVLNLQG